MLESEFRNHEIKFVSDIFPPGLWVWEPFINPTVGYLGLKHELLGSGCGLEVLYSGVAVSQIT